MFWSQQEAVLLCKEIESFCPFYGVHVALTGGLLCKFGVRKDLDILFYRINLKPGHLHPLDLTGLFAELERIGFSQFTARPFYVAAIYRHKPVDIMFPQVQDPLTMKPD